MTPREAIENAMGQWFRPVWWRGSGDALSNSSGVLSMRLNGRQSKQAVMTIRDLTCEWEIVDPATVLAERET